MNSQSSIEWEKATDFYHQSVFLTKNRFTPNNGDPSLEKKQPQEQNNNFCLSIKLTAKTELWKLLLLWALKNSAYYYP